MVNYFVGSAYVMALMKIFSQHGGRRLFLYGVSISAGVLDTFIFSRMWGLVCLFSLLLLAAGERYLRKRTRMNFAIFMGVMVLGFLADYSFILLIPYFIIVAVKSPRWRIAFLTFGVFLLLFLLYVMARKQSGLFLYLIGVAPMRVAYETGFMMLKFYFQETYLAGLLVLVLSLLVYVRKKNGRIITRANPAANSFVAISIVVFTIMVILDTAIRYEWLRVRQAAPFILLIFMFAAYAFYRYGNRRSSPEMGTTCAGIIGAIIILFVADRFFWRSLIDARFLIVIQPFLLILIYRTFAPASLMTLSAILVISGIIYISSIAVSDYFPPPSVKDDKPAVYQNLRAYSSDYLRNVNEESPEPFVIDFAFSRQYCRVCEIGTDSIPFDIFDTFRLIGKAEYDPGEIVPKTFILTEAKVVNFTLTDRFQFAYFHPVYPNYFKVFEYRRID